MDEREARLVSDTELLVEHLKTESVRVDGNVFYLLVSVLGVVDLKDNNLHLHSHTDVDVATKLSIGEERRSCLCVREIVAYCQLSNIVSIFFTFCFIHFDDGIFHFTIDHSSGRE